MRIRTVAEASGLVSSLGQLEGLTNQLSDLVKILKDPKAITNLIEQLNGADGLIVERDSINKAKADSEKVTQYNKEVFQTLQVNTLKLANDSNSLNKLKNELEIKQTSISKIEQDHLNLKTSLTEKHKEIDNLKLQLKSKQEELDSSIAQFNAKNNLLEETIKSYKNKLETLGKI